MPRLNKPRQQVHLTFMLELEEALGRILTAMPSPVAERVSLMESHRRVLAENILSPLDLPAFDSSSMDGYAVRAEDSAAANSKNPVRLHLLGKAAAGENFGGELAAGTCVRLFTGSPVPRGANAVVMQEDTRLDENRTGEVLILDSVKAGENVRLRGEDVKRGSTLAAAGELLTGARIGLLSAAGLTQVNAARRPVVGLLATGSELKEPGETLAAGQIYESTRPALAPLVKQAGGLAKIFPIVPDVPEETRAALEQVLGQCDIAVTCGGVSVGELDFVKVAFEKIGGDLQFWQVAIKPGRPFAFGRRGGKFLFGLPGNPVSAFVTFLLLARPALLRWQGAKDAVLPAHPGMLAEPLVNRGARRHFMRVALDAEGKVRSAGTQASHVLSSLAAANGLVDVPPQTTLAAGTVVRVLRWE
jgi:molybdopterin molybdotransferase